MQGLHQSEAQSDYLLSFSLTYFRGYKRFYKRTSLEQSDYLKDDCLLIRCVVGVVKTHTEGPKLYRIPLPPSDMGHQFGQLLETKRGTDVNFEVDGEVFAAHKLVLAARSPVFRAQLFGPMKDKSTQCIMVEDIEAPVFKVSTSSSLSYYLCSFCTGMYCCEIWNMVCCLFLVPFSLWKS